MVQSEFFADPTTKISNLFFCFERMPLLSQESHFFHFLGIIYTFILDMYYTKSNEAFSLLLIARRVFIVAQYQGGHQEIVNCVK